MPQYQPGTPDSDRVPISGAWQSDPVVAEFMRAYNARPAVGRQRGGANAADPVWQRTAKSFHDYLTTNRQRLGIPDNYTPDPRTNGQTLYDPNNNVWRDIGITGAALVGGAFAAPAIAGLFGGAAAPTAASTIIPGTGIPTVAGTGAGLTLPTAVAAGSALPAAASPIASSLPGAALPATTPAATTASELIAPLVNNAPAAFTATLPGAATAAGEAAYPLVNTAAPWLASTPGAATPGGAAAAPSNVFSPQVGGNSFNPLSFLSPADIAKLGLGTVDSILDNRAANNATEAQLAASREALAFAKKAYEEQNAKEQARFEATEARRVPYRQASVDTLAEFRRILGD